MESISGYCYDFLFTLLLIMFGGKINCLCIFLQKLAYKNILNNIRSLYILTFVILISLIFFTLINRKQWNYRIWNTLKTIGGKRTIPHLTRIPQPITLRSQSYLLLKPRKSSVEFFKEFAAVFLHTPPIQINAEKSSTKFGEKFRKFEHQPVGGELVTKNK